MALPSAPVQDGQENPGTQSMAGTPGTFMGSDIQAMKKKRMIDQVLQQRQQAGNALGMARMGGAEYYDRIDQMRMDPMNTFF